MVRCCFAVFAAIVSSQNVSEANTPAVGSAVTPTFGSAVGIGSLRVAEARTTPATLEFWSSLGQGTSFLIDVIVLFDGGRAGGSTLLSGVGQTGLSTIGVANALGRWRLGAGAGGYATTHDDHTSSWGSGVQATGVVGYAVRATDSLDVHVRLHASTMLSTSGHLGDCVGVMVGAAFTAR
jgi:hypothetical protein